MHIHVNGKNLEITEAIKAYVKEKLGKVANHYDLIKGIKVVLSVVKNPAASAKHTAEVACELTSGTIHCEESANSMYESIDLLADKLDRQVKKYKDKNLSSKDKSSSIRTSLAEEASDDEDFEEVEELEEV
jgi:putative sigma-54 modulation protein